MYLPGRKPPPPKKTHPRFIWSLAIPSTFQLIIWLAPTRLCKGQQNSSFVCSQVKAREEGLVLVLFAKKDLGSAVKAVTRKAIPRKIPKMIIALKVEFV